MVLNRLCDPGSKLGVLRWLDTVALPTDFGFADSLPSHQTAIEDLIKLGQQWSGKLDAQDAGKRSKGKPLSDSDSGAKARFCHAVKGASLAHLIKLDLKAEAFSYTVDEDRQRNLELLHRPDPLPRYALNPICSLRF